MREVTRPGPHALSRMCEEFVIGWSVFTCPAKGLGDPEVVGDWGEGGLRVDRMVLATCSVQRPAIRS